MDRQQDKLDQAVRRAVRSRRSLYREGRRREEISDDFDDLERALDVAQDVCSLGMSRLAKWVVGS